MPLVFALLLALSAIGPPLLPGEFGPYPLLRWGEVLDLVTPLLMLPAAWLLFRAASRRPARTGAVLLFVAISALWVEGQGMHLGANAIGHHVSEGSGDLQTLTHDLDETLSHFLWHIAIIGFSGLVSWRAMRDDEPDAVATAGRLALTGLAAAVFGFTFFTMVVEGTTAIVGLPGAALVIVGCLASGPRRAFRRPVAAMFVAGYAIALVLCLGWAAMHGWQLVEFSDAGIIQ